MVFTATLKNASRDPQFNVIWGRIYGDTRERFADGTTVRTSFILSEKREEDYIVVTTLNSVYKVYLEEEEK